MSPLLGVLVSFAGMVTLLVTAACLRRDLGAESSRKLVHVGCGGLALSFPWLFSGPAGVVVACGLSAGVLAAIRRLRRVPRRLKGVLGGVGRTSIGEFYFPLAVASTFALSGGDRALYLIPLAILTLADSAAAIVGSRWGSTFYRAWRGPKSAEGSLAFFAVSLATSYGLLIALTDLPASGRLGLALAVALVTTLVEAVATDGTDNLAVPVAAFAMLWLHDQESGWVGMAALGLASAAVFLAKQRRDGAEGLRGWGGRMHHYLEEMFPVPVRLVTATAYVLGVASMVRLGLDVETSLLTKTTLIAIAGVFSHLLLLRLMDELKDVEVDRALFPQRPLPSGRIRETDVRLALAATAVIFVVVNLAVPAAMPWALLVLVYSFLMFRFFFVPDLLREKLLLNLATHNPVVAVVLTYLTAMVAAEHGSALLYGNAGLLLGVVAYFWPATLAWEIARKIRSPEEEDAYVTYSQIFGMRRAVAVVAAVQGLSVALGMRIHLGLELSWIFPAVLSASFAMSLAGLLRFAWRPNPRTSRLRPWAEAYLFGVLAAPLLETLFAGRGG